MKKGGDFKTRQVRETLNNSKAQLIFHGRGPQWKGLSGQKKEKREKRGIWGEGEKDRPNGNSVFRLTLGSLKGKAFDAKAQGRGKECNWDGPRAWGRTPHCLKIQHSRKEVDSREENEF